MKKYISPEIEKIEISSTEHFAAYPSTGCLAYTDPIVDYCPTSDPSQMNHDMTCYEVPDRV